MTRFAASSLLACALALTAAVSAGAASKIAALDDKWRWITSERYELLTNAPERDGREVIEELSIFRTALGQLTGGKTTDPPRPMRIILFNQPWDFEPYQPLDASGKPERWIGMTVSSGIENYVAMLNNRDDDLPRSALKGYAYLLVADQFGALPLWMRVGLVEYLSAYRYLPREHRVEVGRPIAENLQYLNSSSHYPIESLLAMTQDSPEYGRDVPRWLFYAKSWLLVHYLQVGSEQRAGALGRFAQLRSAGEPDHAALAKAAGCSLRELDDELGVYQRRSLMSLQGLEVPERIAGDASQTRPATKEDVAYRLGEYLAALAPERKEEIDAHFQASGKPVPLPPVKSATVRLAPLDLQSAPSPPATAEPASEVRAQERGTPTVFGTLEELAAKIDSGGASAREVEAYAARVMETATRDYAAAKPHVAPARRALTQIVVATPARQDLWSRLNWFCAAEPDPAASAAALVAYQRAIEAAPDTAGLVGQMAKLAVTSGDFTSGRAAAESALARNPSGAERLQVESVLIELDSRAANELRENGRAAEGRKILESRLASSTQPASREIAQGALESFDRALAADSIEARFEAAVALVNSQKIAEGGDALAQFIRDYPETTWAALAREHLDKVDSYLERKRGARPKRDLPAPASPYPPSLPPS